MIKLLTSSDTDKYQFLRLHSLKTDPKAFLATYERELTFPPSYFSNKIHYATQPPIFGIYGYFINNELAAIAQLSHEYHPKMAHLANIYDVYVHPDHRGKALAKKLLKHLIAKAKSYSVLEQLHLKANSLNKPAITLYKKLGFTHIATRKNIVKEPNGTYQHELSFFLSLK